MGESVRKGSLGLDKAGWQVVKRAVERLEVSWQSGKPLSLATLAPHAAGPLRQRVLTELVKVDQEFRWLSGEPKRLEQYLAEWPELRGQPDLMVELVEAECWNRAVAGQPLPTKQELQTRFPDVAAAVDVERIAQLAELENSESCEGLLSLFGGETPRCLEGSTQTIDRPAAEGNGPAAETVRLDSPTTSHMLLCVGQRFDRYEIRGVLGEGGMGTVYRAYDPLLGREVALKVPRAAAEQEGRARFIREARAAAQIVHRNVCPIYDTGDVDGVLYITMPLIEGPTLRERIRETSLTPRQIAEIVKKLADALGKVHGHGLIHRDIKPSNVMMQGDEPLLMDFGLARFEDAEHSLTTRRALLGTVPYMAPEQIDGQPAEPRTDIYSLGVVLYFLLTGRLPFSGSVTEMIHQITEHRVARPRSIRAKIDPALERICLKAMAKAPEERYQSGDELAEDLERYLTGKPVMAPPAPPTRRLRRMGACLALPALLLATVFYFKTGSGTLELRVPADAQVTIDGSRIEIAAGRERVALAVGEHHIAVTHGQRTAKTLVTIRWRGEVVRPRLPSLPPPTAPRHVPFPPSEEQMIFLARVPKWVSVSSRLASASCALSTAPTVLVSPCVYRDVGFFEIDPVSGRRVGQIAFAPSPDAPDDYWHVHGDAQISSDGRYLYATNYYSKYITRVDLKKGNAVQHLRVGRWTDEVWGNDLEISPDQTKLVVALGQDGRPKDLRNTGVAIVNLKDGQFAWLADVRFGDELAHPNLAFSGDGRYVYVVTKGVYGQTASLHEIRLTPPYEITRSLPFDGAALSGLAVVPSFGRAYVSDSVHRNIWVVDLKRWRVIDQVEVFGHAPEHLKLMAGGRLLLVLCRKTRRLACLDLHSGTWVGGVCGLDQDSIGMTVSSDGRYIIVPHFKGRIAIIPLTHLFGRIVFASDRTGGSYQLFVTALDGTKVLQLTDDRSVNRCPRWSPDGRRVAFLSDRSGPLRVCIIDRTDWRVHVLEATDPAIHEPATETPLDWSPDGSEIAFVGDSHHAIRIVNVKSGQVRTVLRRAVGRGCDHYNDLCWSRTDEKIFFTAQTNDSVFNQDIYCLEPETGRVVAVTNEWGKRPYFKTPAVSRDGSRLVAVQEPGPDAASRHLVILHPDGSDLRRVDHPPDLAPLNPRWFPDGEKVVCSSGLFPRRHLFWVRIDGTLSAQLTAGEWDDVAPDLWAPPRLWTELFTKTLTR